MAKQQKSSNSANSTGFNPVRQGHDPRKDSMGGNWLKLEPGVPVEAICLANADDILAVEQVAIWLDDGNSPVWTYTGPNDPLHDLHLDKRYKAFLPVIADGEPKIWGMGRQAHMQLLDIADASGELKGQVLVLKRTGTGLQTKYSITQRGKRKDVSGVEEIDILSALGPLTAEGVRKLIEDKLGMPYAEVVKKYNPGKGAVADEGKKVQLPDLEDDDDELDDLELA